MKTISELVENIICENMRMVRSPFNSDRPIAYQAQVRSLYILKAIDIAVEIKIYDAIKHISTL